MRWLSPLLSAGLLALLSIAPVQLAMAHNQVAQTTPAAGSTVTMSPVEIEIVTTDQLLDLGGNASGFAVTVQDSARSYFGDGCVRVDGPALYASAELGNAGEYTVTYQYISADGHSLSDAFVFFLEPATGHTPTPGQSSPPVCGASADEPADEPTGAEAEVEQETPSPSRVEEESDSDSTPVLRNTMAWSGPIIGAGIVVVAVATMGYLLWERSRSKR